MKMRKDRIITSDYFLRKEGYLATMRKIKTEGLKRIVIIGGSHSGFSCAWMMLKGPADILHNTHIIPRCARTYKEQQKTSGGKAEFKFPDAPVRTISECSTCCTCRLMKPS